MSYYKLWSLKKLVSAICDRLQNQFDAFLTIEGKRGLGKCQIKGNKVLMSNNNWKNIEELKVGDEVISPQTNGNFIHTKVTGIHNRFEDEVYEVREISRDKKLLYTCAGNHNIPINKSYLKELKKEDNKRKRKHYKKLIHHTAKEISLMYSKDSKITSFTTTSFETKEIIEPIIEPYILGIYLGDGSFSSIRKERTDGKGSKGNWLSRSVSITTQDEEVMDEILKTYEIIKIYNKKDTPAKMLRFSINGEFTQGLIKLGLEGKGSSQKFIPRECFKMNLKNKLKLLAGIIDSDGYVMKKGDNHIEITTQSKVFGKDINNLVHSLGGYSKIREVKKKLPNKDIYNKYFTVSVSFENPKIIPLKIKRKRERLGKTMKHNPRHIAIRCIKTEPQQVYGIELENSPSKWYVTDNYMITHNSTLAYKIVRLVRVEMNHRGVDGYKFLPRRDLLYQRDEVLRFFHKRKHSGIADEMINVSFNRDFYNETQKDLIKMINMNRDHCNLFIACVPQFKTLDSQIKNLCAMKITVLRRGMSIVHMPNQTVYSSDIWDEAFNEKIERKWLLSGTSNPRYQKLTTFRGFLKFPKLSDKQEMIYQMVKDEKRNLIAQAKGLEEEEETNPFKIIYKALTDGKIGNVEMLNGMILAHGLKDDAIKRRLRNQLRKDSKITRLSTHYFDSDEQIVEAEKKKKVGQLSSLIQEARGNVGG